MSRVNDSPDERESFQELMKEYWQHARHQEWQRSTFTATFTVAIGAVIGFMSQEDLSKIAPYTGMLTMSFLTGLSLVGYFVIFKWSSMMWKLNYLAEKIALDKLGMSDKYSILAHNDLNNPKFIKFVDKFRASHTFMVYYSTMTSVFATAIYSWSQPIDQSIFFDWKIYLIFFLIYGSLLTFYFIANGKIVKGIKSRFDEKPKSSSKN